MTSSMEPAAKRLSVEKTTTPSGLPPSVLSPAPPRSPAVQILSSMPAEWRGTTFNNSNLLGREGFAANLNKLLATKASTGEAITTDELENLGMAEDYLRVATNVSTTFEALLARTRGMDVSRIFSFASVTMPIISVALVATGSAAVHVYHGSAPAPLTPEQLARLSLIGARIECHAQAPPTSRRADGATVLCLEGALPAGVTVTPGACNGAVDGVVGQNLLCILNAEQIDPAQVLVIRKRLATPATTPMAEAMLRRLDTPGADVGAEAVHGAYPVDADKISGIDEFLAHLQTLSGTKADPDNNPVIFTAGLPAIASLWVTLVANGGADILMCSTAYGGSSQVTDLLSERTGKLRKHTFDIQGEVGVNDALRVALGKLSADAASLLPTTVLFLECPTNPDMKVPDLTEMVRTLQEYKRATGKEVVLLVDTTFAPNSQTMAKVAEIDPELTAVVFISMSKSVSRGMTTAGALIANGTRAATDLVRSVSNTAQMFGTTAKPDQVALLVANHKQVEERCQKAYEVADTVGRALVATVRAHTGETMALAFVKPEHAAVGITSSTFSFNLPGLRGEAAKDNEHLAQRFVDLITAHPSFKPCVSFGQDNGLVYCTVPATSTQGAIKAEDKAKQAVGGVQLTRLSFPPTLDTTEASRVIEEASRTLYKGA
jgi:cystathionine beta-lyase/cystathionine gamma-synthase